MTSQPRIPAGARHGDVSAAGRFTHKTVPDVKADDLGFNDDDSGAVGVCNDWDRRAVRVGNSRVVFNRVVGTDNDGNTVTAITTDCDPPDMLLLARKGDVDYWSEDNWRKNHNDRKLWCADIAVNMLREGLISTGHETGVDGLRSVVSATNSVNSLPRWGFHVLTSAVAQIRAVRFLQSMTNRSERWRTHFGGTVIPGGVNVLMRERFEQAFSVYKCLRRPPWTHGMPWGQQDVAGHATTMYDDPMFVGENSDLLWRALTETDHYGMSPLKAGVCNVRNLRQHQHRRLWTNEMVAAAALYDDTAAEQLTTGLFEGVHPGVRAEVRTYVLDAFDEQLNPEDSECRWTPEQQERIRGFAALVERLEL